MMIADSPASAVRRCSGQMCACAHAAEWMYEAEIALHAARQTHVDVWIGSAYDNLHRAVAAHRAAAAWCDGCLRHDDERLPQFPGGGK
jgi:hypothetical protein